MLRKLFVRSAAAVAVILMAAVAPAEEFSVEGTGEVMPDFTPINPNTYAFHVALSGTLTVGGESYEFADSVFDVVQIFPPGESSSFYTMGMLDLGDGDSLTVATIEHYSRLSDCYEGMLQIVDGTGVFAGARGSGMTLTCPPQGIFAWEGSIR